MSRNDWGIARVNGVLLAAYFIPAWTLVALRIVTSPIQGLYERPNVAVGLFTSDVMQLSGLGAVRVAWLLALAKLTVVAFFALFLILASWRSIRKSGGCDEALALALGIGTLISFASMVMASAVGEVAALHQHATELLLLLGAAIVMLIERPVQPSVVPDEHVQRVGYPSIRPSS